jgi:hypothetical protein
MGAGRYAVITASICALAIWLVPAVATQLFLAIDAAILDGSGHASAERDAPAAVATTGLVTTDGARSEVGVAAGVRETEAAAPRPTAPAAALVAITTGDDPAVAFHNGGDTTYRTFCVRLCDGYFWPVSFSTTSDRFERDQEICEASCGSPTRLFVHAMPGGNATTMTSLKGVPYTGLKTAFLFRSTYNAQCKCRANPWEQQAKDRHQLYAAAAAAKGGDSRATEQARELAQRVAAVSKAETAAKAQASAAAEKELAAIGHKIGTKPVGGTERTAVVKTRRTSPEGTRLALETSQPGVMRLGALEQTSGRGGWRPASGTSRKWQERAFGGQ